MPRVGAIACLLDCRDGTNHTGLNPKHCKWIRHIGITGHENPAVHRYAIQRDSRNILETKLGVVNPNDPNYFCPQTNSIPIAYAKGMGIIGMKVFADAVMYSLEQAYAHRPGQSVPTVGKPDKLPPKDLIRYSLSPRECRQSSPGSDSLTRTTIRNATSCLEAGPPQVAKPLSRQETKANAQTVAERRGVLALLPEAVVGLPAPAGCCHATPAHQQRPHPVALRLRGWRSDRALRGVPSPRAHGATPFRPQTTLTPFSFDDTGAPESHGGGVYDRVCAADTAGRYADSWTIKV